MAFLRENSVKWQERKVTECERVKEEAKEDRLAVSRMKKKRYGIKRLSKEENKRLKETGVKCTALPLPKLRGWTQRYIQTTMPDSERPIGLFTLGPIDILYVN